jgi:hypothetical protein
LLTIISGTGRFWEVKCADSIKYKPKVNSAVCFQTPIHCDCIDNKPGLGTKKNRATFPRPESLYEAPDLKLSAYAGTYQPDAPAISSPTPPVNFLPRLWAGLRLFSCRPHQRMHHPALPASGMRGRPWGHLLHAFRFRARCFCRPPCGSLHRHRTFRPWASGTTLRLTRWLAAFIAPAVHSRLLLPALLLYLPNVP